MGYHKQMKLLKLIKKNLRILIRSKSSAFMVIIGPLLIIALIALAFSNTQDSYEITLGVISGEESELATQFINQLENEDYVIQYYNSLDECQNYLKLKTTNLCIVFPGDFFIENNKTNEIEFYVDQSRMNIVESIISSASSTLDLKSEEISILLTNQLLETLTYTSKEIVKEKNVIDELKTKISSIDTSNKQIATRSESTKLNEAVSSLANADTNLNQITSSRNVLSNDTTNLLEDLDNLLDKLEEDGSFLSDTNKVRAHYNELKDSLTNETVNIDGAIGELRDVINSLEEKISSANDNMVAIKSSVEVVKTDLAFIQSKLGGIEASLSNTESKIDEIAVTSADSIVTPFSIKINPILSSSNKSVYIFPYFIILMILFVGTMLSSTLIVMEKKSRAFFRTFTAPTSELYHLFAGYLTNFFVIIAQLIIIFIAAFFYLKISLAGNYYVTIIILFLSVSFFIFFGTLIGYLFKTPEGTTIASISIGSLFLFLSNIILPVESFSEFTRKILLINPYMLCSELLKKSVLFDARIMEIKYELLLLLGYVVIVFVLSVIAQKYL